ncbi:hypothetical protein D1872_161020 [compost metagenome]
MCFSLTDKLDILDDCTKFLGIFCIAVQRGSSSNGNACWFAHCIGIYRTDGARKT